MSELMQASQQWATRPADQRFLSLHDMYEHLSRIRSESRAKVISSRQIDLVPEEDHKGLQVVGPTGQGFAPSHWSFNQLAQLAGAPAGYLRTLPSEIAADAVNYGLKFNRDIEDVGLLLQQNGERHLRAATGPKYGRIWNDDIVRGLVKTFGDGVSGTWRVPGEFGKAVDVTKKNTTLFAGDRDMFVFLADEENRIEVPNRRNGEAGSMARGFFVWNSEVGSSTFGISTFLFDYVCANRIVWGAQDVKEIRIRHTVSAPDRFLQEIKPALQTYANASTHSITSAIENARKARIETDVTEFLAKRFTKRMAGVLQQTHLFEEGRPIETLWDASTAVTAYAKTIEWQDQRVEMERKGGELIALAQ